MNKVVIKCNDTNRGGLNCTSSSFKFLVVYKLVPKYVINLAADKF